MSNIERCLNKYDSQIVRIFVSLSEIGCKNIAYSPSISTKMFVSLPKIDCILYKLEEFLTCLSLCVFIKFIKAQSHFQYVNQCSIGIGLIMQVS